MPNRSRSRRRSSSKRSRSRSHSKVRILSRSKRILQKGALTNLGYHPGKSARSRHMALNKAQKKYGYSSLVKKLNFIATVNKNRSPGLSEIYKRDMRWLESK